MTGRHAFRIRVRRGVVTLAVLVAPVLLAAAAAYAGRPQASPSAPAASDEELAIVDALQATVVDWNRGNLDGFMALYDESTSFVTGAGVIGRDALRQRYATSFFTGSRPDQQLRFDELILRPLGRDHLLMISRYVLSGGGMPDRSGRFTLVWGRTPAGWRILHDHSS